MERGSSPIPSKVGISLQRVNGEYGVFFVDVNSTCVDEVELTPTIRLVGEYFDCTAFCMFGSTLYLFDGYHSRNDSSNSKYIRSYELPSNISDLVLEKSMLKKVCSMKGYKYYPVVKPLPTGNKILVFSFQFEDNLGDEYCHFELFDPVERKCQKLPELFPVLRHLQIPVLRPLCQMDYFTFIGKSVLFLLIDEDRGMYTLDLTEPEDWKVCSSFYGVSSVYECPLQVVDNGICLTPNWACSVDTEELPFATWVYGFPELSSVPGKDSGPNVVFLDITDPRDFKFGIFQQGIEEAKGGMCVLHMVLDVYKCDLVECRRELTKHTQQLKKENLWDRISRSETPSFLLPHTFKVKTLKFSLKPRYAKEFEIFSLYSFPAETISHAEPSKGRKRSFQTGEE